SILILTAPATHAFSPLSLHDALPILRGTRRRLYWVAATLALGFSILLTTMYAFAAAPITALPHKLSPTGGSNYAPLAPATSTGRSEEHTSELQSRSDLVCRLLLEKKK